MDKNRLKQNFINILKTTGVGSEIINSKRIKMRPVFEKDKKYNSKDDVVRLWAYNRF